MPLSQQRVSVITGHTVVALAVGAVCDDAPDLCFAGWEAGPKPGTTAVFGPDQGGSEGVRLQPAGFDDAALVRRIRQAGGRPPFGRPLRLGLHRLSPREVHVVRGLVRGRSPSDLAIELGLARSTVSTVVRRAAVKLGSTDRHALVSAVRTVGSFERRAARRLQPGTMSTCVRVRAVGYDPVATRGLRALRGIELVTDRAQVTLGRVAVATREPFVRFPSATLPPDVPPWRLVEALEDAAGVVVERHLRTRLSDRERRVVRAMAAGQSPAAIAAQMGVARTTVSTYVARAKAKLGVESLPEMFRLL